MRLLRGSEASGALDSLGSSPDSPSKRLLQRKLSLHPSSATSTSKHGTSFSAADLVDNAKTPSIKDAADNAFIPSTTPYENSFASRLYGFVPTTGLYTTTSQSKPNLLYCDWDNKPPWVELLEDIHGHYSVKE
jgi:hypothetical protein